ncbi:23S rRNA (adenine(2503)-C(2))-methyltransferase RlmN [Brevifollis gellanilyticus]|uniref:Probable dual-specificity RNA methyltransferase RlmN n=1 Tax=Brevifollis gellanilyticus TaxID=748831 RepID=A0A512MG51_9BACT|nr:23S rRNA (adenine(2503)-C(2))-methyltransferase RlmN [Brevifollis gellanilyticus]GEP45712.1 putative dual-specificity RNA methyltransferase RlmN [Brevifollis gellanilyticus]
MSTNPPSQALPSLLGTKPEEVAAVVTSLGEPAFRAKQIVEWTFKKRATGIEAMSSLSKPLRQALAEKFVTRSMTLSNVAGSEDTTRKILLKLHDGRYVETVLIPASPALYSERSDRLTLCVSSQVGCAYDCKFCASGLAGFTRNLTAGEIVEQIVQAEAYAADRVDNLVFMGMGEPLANFSNLVKAIEILNAEWGIGIGARHMTVSTSGLAPQIKKLADVPLQIRLAISLHGASDEVRSQIMPVNKKHNIAELFEALQYWRTKHKQRITLEYILIEGVNDMLEQARLLAKRARSIDARVNLIPYNTVEGLPWVRPSEAQCIAFRDTLAAGGVTATLRLEKGHDIAAACGQLRLKQETEEGIIESPIPEKRITIGAGAA